ncbi:hypothetical protein EG329_003475 [Mollisiaceae sp. DMI_Dod_QoI]|nr:hypothetical protein EG329_003475 [Helotiales sp. DMI_Dod_QoI]
MSLLEISFPQKWAVQFAGRILERPPQTTQIPQSWTGWANTKSSLDGNMDFRVREAQIEADKRVQMHEIEVEGETERTVRQAEIDAEMKIKIRLAEIQHEKDARSSNEQMEPEVKPAEMNAKKQN